jgi:hypothetical protein
MFLLWGGDERTTGHRGCAHPSDPQAMGVRLGMYSNGFKAYASGHPQGGQRTCPGPGFGRSLRPALPEPCSDPATPEKTAISCA